MIASASRRLLGLAVSAGALVGCQGSTGPRPPHVTHPSGHNLVSVGLSGRPHGFAVASSGTFCVSQIDGNAVTCGSLGAESGAPVFTSHVLVGTTPAHVAVDPTGTIAYTADQSGATMSVVDIAGGTLDGSVPLSGGGFNLLVSPDGDRVYVTTAAGVLHVVDAATLQIVDTVQLGAEANGLAYDAERRVLYVSSIAAGTISAVNVNANVVSREYQVGGGPQRIALSADGEELYVASQQFGLQVLTLDGGAVAVVAGVPPGSVGLALSPDDAELYVTNPPAGEVYVVDRAGWRVLRTLTDMGSPRNVAFNRSGTVAIITDETGFVHFIR